MKRFKFPIIYLNLEALKVEKKKKYLKAKPCRACTFPFVPRVSTQVVCSPTCALELNRQKKSKAFDAETRKRKEGIKKRSDWLREAQTAFNTYIRLRDKNEPCISCGTISTMIKKRNAGHYLSVGAHPELRFNLWNVHLQCEHCNSFLSGNISSYRPRLLTKIGQTKLTWLEGQHDPLKYTIEDIKRIKAIFNKKAKRLKKCDT